MWREKLGDNHKKDRGRDAQYLPRRHRPHSHEADAEHFGISRYAAALTLPAPTDEIVFRICEAIW